ncbi:MAG: DUF2064 domain-containing protein [Bdellovibrionia bacterium]
MNQLKFAVVVFVKTPGLSPIKTRLARGVGEARALQVYKRCFQAIEAKISKMKEVSFHILVPYWAVAEEDGLDSLFWQAWRRIAQGQGALGDRLDKVYRELLNQFDGVILMGADSPLFSEGEVLAGIEWLAKNKNGVFIGPTCDGGYFVFGGRSQIPTATWTMVPYSENKTLEIFLRRLDPSLLRLTLSEHWDVDTPKDLERLERESPGFLD